MKRLTVISILPIILVSVALSALAQQQAKIYDIDVSRSMLVDGKFAAAQQALVDHIQQLPAGIDVAVVKFGTTADKVIEKNISDQTDREDIIQAIRWLSADENWTQFNEMIKEDRLISHELRSQYNGNVNIQVIVLSDGISSPDPSTGTRPFNLESVVSQTFPQAQGYNVYLLRIDPGTAMRRSETTPAGLTTITVPPGQISYALDTIDKSRPAIAATVDSSSASVISGPRNPKWIYLLATGLLFLAVSYFGYEIFSRYAQKQRQFKERVRKLTAVPSPLAPAHVERLRIRETELGFNAKEDKVQQEAFHAIIKGGRILVGGDPTRCAFILRYPTAPEVMFSLSIGEATLTIKNGAKVSLTINKSRLKPGHVFESDIGKDIVIVFENKVQINIAKVTLPLKRNQEEKQARKLAEGTLAGSDVTHSD